MKRKQQKVEEKAKKIETFEKKKNLQHQEKFNLKEDKRAVIKERTDVLKKFGKEKELFAKV